ncbi:hypothetical protein ACFUNF_41880 [Streptomyces sp. NPDC057291]|uniref:hypothetical protein n=1 Tax=Streptomyces sp. NPDC057291 TaxID=3346087 RepID=UPI00362B8B03
MRKSWMYQFRDGPEREVVEILTEQDARPRQVLVRQCPDGDGLVDGYVLQHVDAPMRAAVCTWVRRGELNPVAAYLLELLAEVCPKESAR